MTFNMIACSTTFALRIPTIRRRFLSTVDLETIHSKYQVHRRGDSGYGSREYLLVPPHHGAPDVSVAAAALLAHRNIAFGARSLLGYPLKDVCLPLVDQAVRDAGENGEQPQAIAALDGMCDWIKGCLETNGSQQLELLRSNDPSAFEAVVAVATGIPRPGHSVLGMGTFRDAEAGWNLLAREFVELELCAEAELYRHRGARLVKIEHLADRNPTYLASAGGAMARFFFL